MTTKKIILQASIIIFLISFSGFSAFSQFPGPAGSPGSSAMYKDSSDFINWAVNCSVNRGLQNISGGSTAVTSLGTEIDAIGQADGSAVLSLGDGGEAILTFEFTILNGPGPDFAVFENAFSEQFLELAFVSVSSDGINFFQFPATSTIQDTVQIGGFDLMGDATKLHNLAGKYRGSYGTPFDLQELDSISGLNIMHITHVKITDVVGSIDPNYASYDQYNHPINDPFPTPFSSGGFDLDAVGVIHQSSVASAFDLSAKASHFALFPNPAHTTISVSGDATLFEEMHLYSATGTPILHSTNATIDVESLPSGVYFVDVFSKDGDVERLRVVKY